MSGVVHFEIPVDDQDDCARGRLSTHAPRQAERATSGRCAASGPDSTRSA